MDKTRDFYSLNMGSIPVPPAKFRSFMEEWRDVVGYETLFRVSSQGRLFSKRTNKILKQQKNKAGYMVMSTRVGGRKGKAICFKIHRLVAEAYIPNPKRLPVVNHLDTNKINNNLDNLEWTTHSGNARHAYNNGLLAPLCNKSRQKLTDGNIQYILDNYKPYCRLFGSRSLGRKFGVGKNVILRIISNKGYLTK